MRQRYRIIALTNMSGPFVAMITPAYRDKAGLNSPGKVRQQAMPPIAVAFQLRRLRIPEQIESDSEIKLNTNSEIKSVGYRVKGRFRRSDIKSNAIPRSSRSPFRHQIVQHSDTKSNTVPRSNRTVWDW